MNTPHPFSKNPHKTLIILSIPVLLSLTAEPITALVDTAFISSLGVVPLAALGVGTTALSSLFWMFNFLGVGTQTEVAQLYGKGESDKAGELLSLALLLSAGFGILLILLISPTSPWIASLLGASGDVQGNAVRYMQIRLFGAPAVLLTLAVFGALRGLQDMRTPLWIALGVNGLNILLDWLLIFGKGPVPAMGVGGSALASTISQWLGALGGILLVSRKIGLSIKFKLRETRKLLQVGRDMFIRTGILNLFLAYTTRVANNLGANAGAAHQVIRQVWVFTALVLDAYAATVQSLVGFFIGKGSISWAKKVVRVANSWSLSTGIVLGVLMWVGRDFVIHFLVPASSVAVFISAWAMSSLSQPINSIAFLTDGALWGTGDFPYLRNAMIAASVIGIIGLWLLESGGKPTLYWVWGIIAAWNGLRGLFGWIRIWPGVGKSPFRT
jgi:MATE family multidrug resistance protein